MRALQRSSAALRPGVVQRGTGTAPSEAFGRGCERRHQKHLRELSERPPAVYSRRREAPKSEPRSCAMNETIPPVAPVPLTINPQRLAAVRILSALNLVIMCPFVLAWLQLSFVGLIPMAGFAWSAYSLHKQLYAPNAKKGLAMAMAMGVAALVMLIPLAAIVSNGFYAWDWKGIGLLAVAALVMMAWVASAVVALRTAGAEPKAIRLVGPTLLHGFVYLAVPLLGSAIVLPSLVRSPIAANQAATVGSLRTINTAMVTYDSTYLHGFAPSLAALGPPPPSAPGAPAAVASPSCLGADLIDDVLAAGGKNGYVFQLTVGPSTGKDSQGCPMGIQTYSISARPISRKTGLNSYFTDQTGVIRETTEERPATVKDKPIAG